MWHIARCLSVIKRLLCGKRMSHSTLHGFHYPVVIQSLRTGTSGVKHLNGGGFTRTWRMLHFFNDHASTRQFAGRIYTDRQREHNFTLLIMFFLSSSSWEVGQSSNGGLFHLNKTHTRTNQTKVLIWFVSRKEFGSIGFVTFYENKDESLHS